MKKMKNNLFISAIPRQPLISIITVVLNGAHTLEKAIKSVVHQKFRDFEYIIVDGGSIDGSIEIIKKYESKLTCWISELDEGLYDAMNKGVSLARGRWVYFLGADDQLLDGLVMVAGYLKDEKTLYYGNVYRPFIDRIYDGKFSGYKLACRNICHQSIFYPRYVWDKYSFDLKYPIFADYELNLKCFGDTDIKFKYIPATIAIFSDEGGLSRTRGDVAFEKDKLSLIKGIFPFWIYILIFMRSFFVKILAQLRLQKVSIKIYHYFLRAKSIYSAEKKTITKNYYKNK